MRRPASILVLALTLTACATPEPPATIRRAEAVPEPVEITIHTSPPGGVVDWNGNVLGAAPVSITIRPETAFSGRPRWPDTGALTHFIRARWPDGSWKTEIFDPNEIPPQQIGIVSPNILSYRDLAWGEPPRKKGMRPIR
jgi:hypothetical protein